MHSTSNHPGMPLPDPTSRQIGKHEGNVSKITKANSLNAKDLVRPLSTPLPHLDHGTINPFRWMLIKPENQEGIGEGKGEVYKEET